MIGLTELKAQFGSMLTEETDGSISIVGNVSLSRKSLSKMPVKFKNITGNFSCSYNDLVSLEGCPESVTGTFFASNNRLTTLKFAPKIVGKSFHCGNNKLTDLEGSPTTVPGDFFCMENDLLSLKGSPESIGGFFDCSFNPDLKSLEGAPKRIGEEMFCFDALKLPKKELETYILSIGRGFQPSNLRRCVLRGETTESELKDFAKANNIDISGIPTDAFPLRHLVERIEKHFGILESSWDPIIIPMRKALGHIR